MYKYIVSTHIIIDIKYDYDTLLRISMFLR